MKGFKTSKYWEDFAEFNSIQFNSIQKHNQMGSPKFKLITQTH